MAGAFERVVIVEFPRGELLDRHPSHRLAIVDLGHGDSVTFGRGAGGVGVDVVVGDRAVSRLAGEIQAFGDYWLLTNFSRDKTYVVENPEGAGEFVKVPPGRVAAPVPFELSRVVLPLIEGTYQFMVYAPAHQFAETDPDDDGLGEEPTPPAFCIDTTAKYFLILVALCELRLRDRSPVAIPTIQQVLDRLRPLPSCSDLTRSAVNFHIDYLAGRKLGVKAEGVEEGNRLEWKREAVVSAALRLGLVREEHLKLLPSARRSALIA
jgi:hypothetical protein